ncbi:MAG: hypothetical protein IPN19_04965 [Elusimicrobia bacterium]|nr:hypothetical protein [Elusimicrobiota bacterium]
MFKTLLPLRAGEPHTTVVHSRQRPRPNTALTLPLRVGLAENGRSDTASSASARSVVKWQRRFYA